MTVRRYAWLLGLLSLPALAADVTVSRAWARATLPGQPVAGAYFDIQAATPARLLAVSSPVAAQVELHEMKLEGGIMKMRRLPGLDLAAGQTLQLKPGSYHVMLMQLATPLAAGQTVPLVIHVEQAGKRLEIAVTAEVRGVAAQ
ncbi:copper chaperone PCu(A)C [Chitinimonas naiadis]